MTVHCVSQLIDGRSLVWARRVAAIHPLEHVLRADADAERDLITPTQLRIVAVLHRCHAHSGDEVAIEAQLPAAAVSEAIRDLVNRGFIDVTRTAQAEGSWTTRVAELAHSWIDGVVERREHALAMRIADLDGPDRAALAAAVPVLHDLLAIEQ